MIAARRGRRRRPGRAPAARPDPLYPLKIKIASELGLLDKVRQVGWGGLTSAESGRVGGLMMRVLRGMRLPLRLWPGRSRGRRAM